MNQFSNEAMLLGCAMRADDPTLLDNIDFADYPAIAAAVRVGKPCDPQTVLSRLLDDPDAIRAHGSSIGPILYGMWENATGGAATATVWRKAIRDSRRRETLMRLGQRLFQAAADDTITSDMLADIARQVRDELETAL